MAAGIILAAGESRRMGRDKALLSIGQQTFLGRLAGLFVERLDPVIAVVGHHRDEIEAAVKLPEGAAFARNPDYRRGMLTSLQCGLRALHPGSQVLFTLVDVAAVSAKSVRLISEALERGSAPIVIPRCEGKRGHPVGIRWQIAEELLALEPNESPQTVMRRDRSRVQYLDVDDPFVLRDADTPEQYRGLIADEVRYR